MNAGLLSRMPRIVNAWLQVWITPFYRSLSPLQKICFVSGVVLMPVYILDGHLFLLLDAVGDSIGGQQIPLPGFFALMAETILIIHSLVLALQYNFSSKRGIVIPRNLSAILPHGCLTIKGVPLYLYKEERRTNPVDAADLLKGFTGMDTESKVLLDKLPKALEILKNNAAMLEIYEQSHTKAQLAVEREVKPRSLLDILNEDLKPVIETATDIDAIIHSKK